MIKDWNETDERRKQGTIKHWEKEINNFNQAINDRIAELEERGERYD